MLGWRNRQHAVDLKSTDRKVVRVQVPSPVPITYTPVAKVKRRWVNTHLMAGPCYLIGSYPIRRTSSRNICETKGENPVK